MIVIMIVIKVLQLELSYDYKIIEVIVTLQMMTGKKGATWSYMVFITSQPPLSFKRPGSQYVNRLSVSPTIKLSLAISEREESL